MKKSDFRDPEGTQVIFDLASIVVAGALGGLGAVVTGSPEVGALATGIIAATGIGVTRIDPARQKLDAATRALTPLGREETADQNEGNR